MQEVKVNILGTDYTVKFTNPVEYGGLETAYGLTDFTTKTIYIDDLTQEPVNEKTVGNTMILIEKTLKHEITHACLYESGLNSESAWARNEEVVDWIALQLEKIYDSFCIAICKYDELIESEKSDGKEIYIELGEKKDNILSPNGKLKTK